MLCDVYRVSCGILVDQSESDNGVLLTKRFFSWMKKLKR